MTQSIQILVADLLALRARELLEQIAFGAWPPGIKLRDALDTYSAIRPNSSPQRIPAPADFSKD